jgi:hypothetical protein
MNKRISKLQKKTTDYQCMTMLLAKHDIPGMRRLLAVAFRNGASTAAIITKLNLAIAGVYSPKGGWSEWEYDIAYLVKSIGGPKLLYALQKAAGLPSISTVKENRKPPQLLPCVTTPKEEEMKINIESILGPDGKPPEKLFSELIGQILMIDGAALEELCRYEAFRNVILGHCRECSGDIKTTRYYGGYQYY